jgi:hypothetical protein
LLEPLTDADFGRLSIYGPLVRVLEADQPGRISYELRNWSALLNYARIHTLLPNLESIVIEVPPRGTETSGFPCFTAFSSPSLTHIALEDDILPRSAPLLFRGTFHQHPRLGPLAIRSLDPTAGDQMNIPLTDLPGNAFPSLQALTLSHIMPPQVIIIWQMQPIVKGLTSVQIGFARDYDNIDVDLEGYAPRFLPLLCSGSPHLAYLALDFYPGHDYDDDTFYIVSADLLGLLGMLPLRSLHVNSAVVGSENAALLLAHAFPRICTLRWPDQAALLHELDAFADNPNLEHLSLRIDLLASSTLESIPGVQFNSRPTFQDLETDLFDLCECESMQGFKIAMYV